MRVEYQKTKLSYGGYRPGCVIWITLLNGQKAEKFNLLDRDGNVLYRVEQKNDGDGVIDNKITYESLTEEQKEEIQRILEKNEPHYSWDKEEIEEALRYFGYEVARLDDLVRYARKSNKLVVDYDIYSSYEEDEEGKEIDDLSAIDYYEVGSITRETIENNLVQKLLEHKEWDTIEMKIIENGQIDSYLLEFEERGD
ncbi:hypothetical protein [Enterococcus raffinosus]|uniref:hypothetical protein n=1 Tax=Enterococcus raffinosus TaxID=71452 RepID=UPI0028FD046D|nr:hypothetical protein NUITMVRE36_00820 [Enterococcus raffinosus]